MGLLVIIANVWSQTKRGKIELKRISEGEWVLRTLNIRGKVEMKSTILTFSYPVRNVLTGP